MGLQIAVWYEPDEQENTPPLSRRQLAKQMGVHFNTLRKDELLIKKWVRDAARLYRGSGDKLEGIPLTQYLVWLLFKVRSLRTNKAIADTEAYVFQHPEQFTEQAFNDYVQANIKQVRRIENAA